MEKGGLIDDNRDNLRPNQYPLGAQRTIIYNNKNNLNQQHSARNNTTSGRGIDDNIDNLRPNQKHPKKSQTFSGTPHSLGRSANYYLQQQKQHLRFLLKIARFPR